MLPETSNEQGVKQNSAEELKASKALASEGSEAIAEVERQAEKSGSAALETRAKLARIIIELGEGEFEIRPKRERSNTVRMLRESERRFKSLLGSMNDIVLRMSPEGFYTDYLETANRQLVAPPEEFIGKHFKDVLPPYVSDLLDSAINKIVDSGQPVNIDYFLELKDGKKTWFNAALSPEMSGEGKIISITVVIRDITNRKHTENILRETQNELQVIFESEPTPSIVIDSDRKILRANKVARFDRKISEEDVIGVRLGEMLGCVNSINSLGGCGFGPECVDCEGRKLVQEVIDSGKPSGTVLTKFKLGEAGNERSFLMSATPLSSEKEAKKKYLVSMQDITEQLEKERQLLQAQKMEAVGQLAGGVAHDFNNILAVIMGLASMMQAEMSKDNRYYEDVKQIVEAAKRGKKTANDLLGFARQSKYKKEIISSNSLLEKMETLFRRAIPQRINFEKILCKTPAIIECDINQLSHVLLNLVINAIDAIEDKGSIIVAIGNVELKKADLTGYPNLASGEYVEFKVIDDGKGMEEEELKKCLEPFYTTKDVGKGTGLGLAMVYGTIQNHGGMVKIDSTPGEGTIVSIYLPVCELNIALTKAPKKKPITGGIGVGLVVDDDEMVLKAVCRMIEGIGYSVFKAQSGRKALEIYKKHQKEIKFVLLDMSMPGMDGMETLGGLKKIDPEVAVLFLSGYNRGRVDNVLNTGAAGFLEKPIEIEKLSKEIHKLFKHKK